LYPYGDTRYDSRPLIDDGDERAARRTVRFLGVGLFVAVMAVTLVLSLLALGNNAPQRVTGASSSGPQQPATPAAIAGLGPQPGLEIGGYVQNRKAALAALKDERVAVVSLVKYVTETQAKAVAGGPPVALLVAPAGLAPTVVTTDLATWAKTQTDATRAERDEIKKLLPTVDDPAFKTFYQSEVDRLDKAVKNFSPDGAIVFGVVVKAPAAALQALGARPDVRLVDVGDTNVPEPKALYRGLRPEEQAKANEPSVRPA